MLLCHFLGPFFTFKDIRGIIKSFITSFPHLFHWFDFYSWRHHIFLVVSLSSIKLYIVLTKKSFFSLLFCHVTQTYPGMVPYKRAGGDKSNIPLYQPNTTGNYQQIMHMQQPFVPVSCECYTLQVWALRFSYLSSTSFAQRMFFLFFFFLVHFTILDHK